MISGWYITDLLKVRRFNFANQKWIRDHKKANNLFKTREAARIRQREIIKLLKGENKNEQLG